MRLSYTSRFWLYAPLALFLGLACWVMAYWWIIAGALEKKLTALNGHEAVPGVTLSWTNKTISGFPFNIDVVFHGLSIKGAGAHGPFAWRPQQFALHRLTYGRDQDIYEAAGGQDLEWSDVKGAHHMATFLPGTLRASAIFGAKGLARFDLDLKEASGKSDGAAFSAGRIQFHLRRDSKADTLDLMLDTDSLKTVSGTSSIMAYLALTHGTAFAPLLAGTQTWPQADAAWMTAGGAVMAGKATGLKQLSAAGALLGPLF